MRGRRRIKGVVSEERLRTYLENVENAMRGLRVDRGLEGLEEVLDWARRYYSDAKAFAEGSDRVSALVAAAYCEGILEALRLLRLVSFSWSSEAMERGSRIE